MWDEITYLFSNFNDAAVEVWKWMDNFIPDLIDYVSSYPSWEKSVLVKGVPGRNECWYIYNNNMYNVIWVRSRNCGCLVTWFCYQLIAKPGNKTAAVPWPHPYSYETLETYWFTWWTQTLVYKESIVAPVPEANVCLSRPLHTAMWSLHCLLALINSLIPGKYKKRIKRIFKSFISRNIDRHKLTIFVTRK